MKFKGTVAAFADYVQYSPTLWYHGLYNTVTCIHVLFQHKCTPLKGSTPKRKRLFVTWNPK
jgi:hypothetical protein